MPAEALCGTYEVFENRAARAGRKIPLHLVVLPAAGPDRLPDPFVYFAGGPGEPSVPWGFFWTHQLAGLRSKRDVLLIDLRGTGRSGELTCPELRGEQSVQGFLDDFLPVAKVHACRDRLKKEVDLAWYTTDAAVDDVEEVRTALGYGPINLMGSSYGTRAVLTYLRRHPRSVRTATMHGVLPPDVQFLLTMPRNAQGALDGLIAECEGDPACRGAFPKLREEMAAVLHRATTDPVRVELTDPETGQTQELRLTRTAVAQTLRYMLYAPIDAVRVPLEVHLAAQGDWKPLALSARFNGSMGGSAEGLYQSVTCAEDVAPLRDGEIAAAAAGTFLGDFRIRRQKAACEGMADPRPGGRRPGPGRLGRADPADLGGARSGDAGLQWRVGRPDPEAGTPSGHRGRRPQPGRNAGRRLRPRPDRLVHRGRCGGGARHLLHRPDAASGDRC